MVILLLILISTIGLSVRAGLYSSRSTIAPSEVETGDGPWLIDVCARTFLLVLLALLGLLALGILYGNVAGAVHSDH